MDSKTRRWMGWCAVAAALRAFACVAAAAEEGAPPASLTLKAADPTDDPVWKQDLGEGFKKGSLRSTVFVGAGLGSRILGSGLAHDMAIAGADFGTFISDVVGEQHWFRGNWELRAELWGGFQYHPESAYLVGLTPFLRYDFATGSRWVPFIEGGAGLTATDIGEPDLGGAFQFNVQAGAGMHWFFERHTAATLEYRVLHVSNSGLQDPNRGLNDHLLLLGVSFFF